MFKDRNCPSIIIPSYDRPLLLKDTLKSILQQDYKGNYEILVIDNKPTGQIKVVIKDLEGLALKKIRYIEEPEPGLIAGRHKGAKEAAGNLLIFVDDDIIADENWLYSIIKAFDDPSIHLVGGRNLPLYESEPPEWLEAFWVKNKFGRLCGHLSLLDFGNDIREINPIYVFGLNFSIRKKTLLDIGGFHPDSVPWELRRYRGDGETGLSKKAIKKGLKAIYQPKALIYHRVPKERLTLDYFKKRAFLQGISDSYTKIRDSYRKTKREDEKPSSREIKKIKFHWINSLKKIKQMLKKDICSRKVKHADQFNEIKCIVNDSYKEGYQFHQNEVKNDPELLKWVLKKNYWDYKLPFRENSGANV